MGPSGGPIPTAASPREISGTKLGPVAKTPGGRLSAANCRREINGRRCQLAVRAESALIGRPVVVGGAQLIAPPARRLPMTNSQRQQCQRRLKWPSARIRPPGPTSLGAQRAESSRAAISGDLGRLIRAEEGRPPARHQSSDRRSGRIRAERSAHVAGPRLEQVPAEQQLTSTPPPPQASPSSSTVPSRPVRTRPLPSPGSGALASSSC